MKKKALISVKSIQNNEKNDAIEIITPGTFYKKDEKYYVLYEETEISGMEGTTTKIKVEGNKMTLSRKGTTNTSMNFEKSKREVIMYGTPHGMMQFLVDTKDLDIALDDDGGKINAMYHMFVGNEEPLKTKLEIKIEPQQSEWS